MSMNEITIRSTYTPGIVSINYDEILAEVKARTAHYATVIVTEDAIPEFKQALADLRKTEAALNADRISIKKQWNEPVNDMELKLKPIFAVIAESCKNLDDQLKEYEAKRIQNAREALETIFYVQGLNSVTFDQILKPAWLNKTNEGKAAGLLITECERIKGDLEFIEGIADKAEAVLVRDAYLKSLDLLAAQSQARAILLQVRKAEELRKASEEMIARNSARMEAEAKARLAAVNEKWPNPETPVYQRDTFAESFEKPEPIHAVETPFSTMNQYLISFPDAVEFNEAIEALNTAKVKYTIL